MGRSSARGGRGKGRMPDHSTRPPPSIGGSASPPVTTTDVHGAHPVFVPAQEPTTSPPPPVGFVTPSPSSLGGMAHSSASATSDPISSSIGEIPISPGSQPSSSSGRSSLPQLFVGPGGDMYVSADFSVSHAITRVVKSKFDGPYSKWSTTPAEVKNLWFDEFKKLVFWDPSNDGSVRRLFEDSVKKTLKDNLFKARREYKKGKGRPSWITESVWDALLQHWEADETFKIQSAVGKRNRASDVGGLGFSNYYGGSRSLLGHKRKMEDKLKRNVGTSEIFVVTHKKNDKFSSKKAEKIYETFETLQQQIRESQNEEGDTSSSQNEGEIWCKATGGPQHGRIFGLGSKQQAAGFGVSTNRPSSSSVQSPPQTSYVTAEMLQTILENVNQNMRTNNVQLVSRMNEVFAQWTLQNFGVTPPTLSVDPSSISPSQFHTPSFPRGGNANSDRVVQEDEEVEDEENDQEDP